MHILGFNCYAHDATAAIVRDGVLLGMAEEERFVRRKHAGEFPRHAIRWCCEIAGIQAAGLDHIVYYWDLRRASWQRVWHVLRHFPWSIELVASRWGQEMRMRDLRQSLRQELGVTERTQVHFAAHHLCHAASSFLTSPFAEAAIMSVDAAGEWDCTWLGVGRGLDMTCLKSQDFPHSLGLVYGAVTEFLGYRFASGEGKVMALASYGDPQRYIEVFRDMIRLKPHGEYEIDPTYFAFQYRGRPHWFSTRFYRLFGPPCEDPGHPDQRARDVAAALQLRTEEAGLHIANWLREATGLDTLCLAGGVCLNSVMNGRILRETRFRHVFVQPAANDAGTALGGCYWLWNTVLRNRREYVFQHAYHGPVVTEAQVRAAIDRMLSERTDIEVQRVDDAPHLAAEMLTEQKIVGWFQGRMEIGPRALGNRSILADPRQADMKDLLNSRVKFREGFRPFAPSVLETKTGEWFDTDYPSPYMILVYNVLPEKRHLVPAITHVDGTARVQTISKQHNPRYFRLVEEFERLTGVPMVLNTSFNIRGRPIVLTAEDAIECFLTTGMDALFLGDYVLAKTTDSAAQAMDDAELVAAHAAAAAADMEEA